MQRRRYLMDGATVRRLRELHGLTQEQLARAAGITRGLVGDIEHDRGPKDKRTAIAVARVFGVTLEDVVQQFVYDTGMAWIRPPDLPDRDMRAYIQAAELDMEGEHMAAVEALEALRGRYMSLPVVQMANLRITLAVYLDHAGRHTQAQQQLQIVLGLTSRSPAWKQVVIRAEYHLAISYRREHRWPDAEEILERLLKDPTSFIRPAALHQRGVIRVGQRRWGEAREDLTQALAGWRQTGSHRVGFTLRRLAELDVRDGYLGEALKNYYEAGTILAHHRCTRYVERIRLAVEELAVRIDSAPHPPAREG